VPPADPIPCGGFPPFGRVVPPADFDSLRGEIPPAFGRQGHRRAAGSGVG